MASNESEKSEVNSGNNHFCEISHGSIPCRGILPKVLLVILFKN